MVKGKLPPMSAANGLQLIYVPDDVKLTDLENNLMARKILFQKIYRLPKSRIGAVKDKIVNIPISEEDVDNTLQLLPRTPQEGGLVEIKLKRKRCYKNYHKQEYISPLKIFKAIKFLKCHNNPFYESVSDIDTFKNKCMIKDPDGYQLLFGEEYRYGVDAVVKTDYQKCVVTYVDDNNCSWEEVMDLRDYLISLEEEKISIEDF